MNIRKTHGAATSKSACATTMTAGKTSLRNIDRGSNFLGLNDEHAAGRTGTTLSSTATIAM